MRIRISMMATVFLSSALTVLTASPPAAHAATTNTIALNVVSSMDSPDPTGPRSGDAITAYQYLINEDNTGNADDSAADCEVTNVAAANNAANFPVNFPDNCQWPSLRTVPGSAPIVTQGTQADFAAGLNLPDGKFLISVVADGHKIGGAHFTVPMDSAANTVYVALDPYPIALGTVRIRVFNDSASTNGQIDMPAEGPPGVDDTGAPVGTDMSGFQGTISEWAGLVTTDWFGNPLCTEYEKDANGKTLLVNGEPIVIAGTGGRCLSDSNGDIVIPNLGSNRYAAIVTPPTGSDWVQTTTLEGGLDWDIWQMDNESGFDTEFIVGAEQVPWVTFGFVHPRSNADGTAQYFDRPGGTGEVKGTVGAFDSYVPGFGQGPVTGTVVGGYSGGKMTGPIPRPYVAVSDLQDGDRTIYVGRGDELGRFDIKGLSDGDYVFTFWDEQILYLLDTVQVTVHDGQVVDTGVIGLTGWFANFHGSVFVDSNENGRRDPGEEGVPDFGLVLKNRANNLQEVGQNAATTDTDGNYEFSQAYPLVYWIVMEAYSDRYRTTGVTYQAGNQPTETTVIGGGVDVNVLPTIGQSARLDWGVVPYKKGENGGIVGSVVYDTTRNELDTRLAATEDWAPGIPNIPVSLYTAVPDGNGGYTKGDLVDTYMSETWDRPRDCVARDADGTPLTEEKLFPQGSGSCVEAPLTGIQVGPMEADQGTPAAGFGATVDGNYGFGDLPTGMYLVSIDVPLDAYGKPLYKVEDEESINVFSGQVYMPQDTVGDPSQGGDFADNRIETGNLPTDNPSTMGPGTSAMCMGDVHTVHVDPALHPEFADAGGSAYEGHDRRSCDVRLVRVTDKRSFAPTFHLYTDVPLPARYYGYTVDDLNLMTNPKRASFGEVAGLGGVPMGVYDWKGALQTTVNADPNGLWEVLMPSTLSINCPTPSGVCPGMYRFVGNDPGYPGHRNKGYDPGHRTIAANFQAWPGLTTPADTAPTQVGVSVIALGSQFSSVAACRQPDVEPQLFVVSKPYVSSLGNAANRTITITGDHFGLSQGAGTARLLDGNTVIANLAVSAWNDRQITVTVPALTAAGPHQLEITNSNGQKTVNAITIHVTLPLIYSPLVLEIGPGKTFASIQPALNLANLTDRFLPPAFRIRYLFVVYPNAVSASNVEGSYIENIVVNNAGKIQGVGPGGVYADGTDVHGTVLDAGGFWAATPISLYNDPAVALTAEPPALAWQNLVSTLVWSGNQDVSEGEGVYVLARQNQFPSGVYAPGIDGLRIQGGDQRDFPGNMNTIGGGPGGTENSEGGAITTQGGGIFLNAYAQNYRITNNVITGNGGAYGSAIRVGTPFVGDNNNDNLAIKNNRIVANGGSQLAGAIGIFNGADGYQIAGNDICGNFSAEYGGAVSHFGLSRSGTIEKNRVLFNQSYDEGGGISIAGELPANPAALSPGAGAVTIRSNVIASNLSNDDGGGVRFLQAGNYPFLVYNNSITNNVSTHEGGGVALDDAPQVRLVNNTIAGNVTTATAITSNGLPAPAGVSTGRNSQQLQNTLPTGSPTFSDPLLFNNIFRDNRAGTWVGNGVAGIGNSVTPADTTINYWDAGSTDNTIQLSPTNSLLDSTLGTVLSPTNKVGGANLPAFVNPQPTKVSVFAWRTYARLKSAAILSQDLHAGLPGDYHITAASAAADSGATNKLAGNPGAGTVPAPLTDIDGQARPSGLTFEVGADELPGATTFGPVSPVLDNFNRGNASNANVLGTNWRGDVTSTTLNMNGTTLGLSTAGKQYWNAASFGDNQEAFVTFAGTAANTTATAGLLLRFTPSPTTSPDRSSYVEVAYQRGALAVLNHITVSTKSTTGTTTTRATFNNVTLGIGDRLMARIDATGHIDVFRKPGAGAWVAVGSADLGANAPSGARIGLRSTGTPTGVRLDDFGGGSVLP